MILLRRALLDMPRRVDLADKANRVVSFALSFARFKVSRWCVKSVITACPTISVVANVLLVSSNVLVILWHSFSTMLTPPTSLQLSPLAASCNVLTDLLVELHLEPDLVDPEIAVYVWVYSVEY